MWNDILKNVKNNSIRIDDVNAKVTKVAASLPFFKSRQYRVEFGKDIVQLTRREAQVMSYLLLGKTMQSIGFILSISPRTVEFYIQNLKVKFACRTRSELIACVTQGKLIID